MLQMLLHQACCSLGITTLKRLNQHDMLGVRLMGRLRRLIHERYERGAQQQVRQNTRQHTIAMHRCEQGMELAEQSRALGDIFGSQCFALFCQVRLELGNLVWGDVRTQIGRDSGLEHGAHFKDLLGFLDRWLRHERPTPWQERHELVTRELVQSLAYQGSRNREMLTQLLLGEFGPRHEPAFSNRLRDGLNDVLGREHWFVCGGWVGVVLQIVYNPSDSEVAATG